MGQVIVEIPQNFHKIYRINDSEFGEDLIDELEKRADSSRTPHIIEPSRQSIQTDGDAVLGIWADRKESAQEIAKKIREKNRKVT